MGCTGLLILLSRVKRSLFEEELLPLLNTDTGGAEEDDVGLCEERPRRSFSAKDGLEICGGAASELSNDINLSEFLRASVGLLLD